MTLSTLGKVTSAWAGQSPPSPQQPRAPQEARTENITFIVHDQLYKRNVPTRVRVRGPFHERALEKARERARERGQLLRVHEGHSVPTWHKGCSPSPLCPPQWAEPPQHWQRSWAGGCGVAGLSLLPVSPPPGAGAAATQSGTWGRGEHWKLNTALSNHESPEITLPPHPQTHTRAHTHTHISRCW